MPIIRNPDDRESVMAYTNNLAKSLRETHYHHRKIVVEIDDRDIGGARGWDWIKKGIPLRVEIGPRDIAEDSVFVGRRDKPNREKVSMKKAQFVAEITAILEEIQANIFARADSFAKDHTRTIEDGGDFTDFFTPQDAQKPEIHGGFARSPWCGEQACELKIKEDMAVTIRCLPFEQDAVRGSCIGCGKKARSWAIFAKAY
jgi:prolyl-tRNA synthetase